MDEIVERRVLEAITRSPFSDTEPQKVQMVVELPLQERTYQDFLKRGWKDGTDEQKDRISQRLER